MLCFLLASSNVSSNAVLADLTLSTFAKRVHFLCILVKKIMATFKLHE